MGVVKHSTYVLALASVLLFISASAQSDSGRAGDFALLDHEGYFHHMAWYDNNKAIALLVQANGAPEIKAALADFQYLQKTYQDQGIVFFMLNALGESRDSVLREMKSLGSDIPVLIDDVQSASEALGVERVGEALIYDPKSFRVLYRGAAGDTFKAALAEVSAGKNISTPVVASHGTVIDYHTRNDNVPSYSEEIAPIIADNCASCHREGGIAPFALNSHAMAQGWSPMIREVIVTKRMPPGQLDPHVGKFSNPYFVPFEDQRKLLDWIAAGSPRGDGNDPLAELGWPETEWAFGEPDLIINVPPQTIPATGVLDYINVVVPIEGLDRDRWVKASQYLAGDRQVLHHTLNSVIGPGESLRGGFTADGDPNVGHIAAYIPGAEPHLEAPNTGGLLKAGSSIALQLHYTTMGRETVDAGQIGVWFYPDDQIPTERRTGECACIFTPTWTDIPPYHPNFEQQAEITIDADAYVMSFISHMHFRGKYMRFHAHYPDGQVEELMNIPNYNYNWQMEYKLEEPKLVPAGTRIVVTGAFDNSEQNPANPDPSIAVGWGDQSWDEMFFGQVYYKYVDQSRYLISSN
jgi:mono/diheme cytochrome c family protein